MTTETEAPRLVRVASRALGRHGLVHAYGHCSARLDADSFLVCPARPMGLVEVGGACTHQHIYRNRPEAGGVVRFMGPNVMALAALARSPKPRHGFGTYFAPGAPLWNDIQLIRDDEKARGVVETMGTNAGVLMRGNGAVTAGESLIEAVVLAWYLEDCCRVELEALKAGLADTAPTITLEAARARATKAGLIFERMWEHLTFADPELT